MHPDFPSLGESEIYLDSATTSLVPSVVLETIDGSLRRGGSPNRSLHGRGHEATRALAHTRRELAAGLIVPSQELVFVPSATLGLNLIAQGWGPRLASGDEVLVSVAAHNSSFLPWQRECQRRGAALVHLKVTPGGDLDLRDLRGKLSARTKTLAINHVSNLTGACTDVASIVAVVRDSPARDALIVVDGAQAVAHLDAQPAAWGCDFYVYSGHKCYGVPGAAVVWGAAERWAQCDPLWVGGGSVEQASFSGTRYKNGPERYESGTANLLAIEAMGAGLRYAREHRDLAHQQALMQRLVEGLGRMEKVRVLGDPQRRVGCVSWIHEEIHAHDIVTLLNEDKISLRAGHHCAHRLMEHFGARQSLRASFACFNQISEIDALCASLEKIHGILG